MVSIIPFGSLSLPRLNDETVVLPSFSLGRQNQLSPLARIAGRIPQDHAAAQFCHTKFQNHNEK